GSKSGKQRVVLKQEVPFASSRRRQIYCSALNSAVAYNLQGCPVDRQPLGGRYRNRATISAKLQATTNVHADCAWSVSNHQSSSTGGRRAYVDCATGTAAGAGPGKHQRHILVDIAPP